ncbi:MAG: murein DD-endopeptidase MepM/ murein hydrolase activator NlpD [Saprospiraceae bacterium]|jgi:murein DD-endopeptidase MepM/ murein hydrolase activator NlpD
MRKEKFVYNTQTLRYEKVVVPVKVKIFKLFSFVSAVTVTAIIIISIAFTYFSSPKEQALTREIDQMKDQMLLMGSDYDNISKVLENIQDRDANVHRMIFGMDPIDDDIWNGGIGGADRYSNLTKYKNTGETLIATKQKIEKLKRQLVIQSKSMDEVEQLANQREDMLASIPAIKPVRSDKLQRNIKSLSGFGMRMHPIWKRKKMHTGIDFTAPKGVAIHATGNGKILEIRNIQSGYGTHVIIDHGYGYKTLYGHMSAVSVKVGQKVTRGQVIGKIGNTGTSTAPHLHYEVINQGIKVNPIHYCMDGLSDQEYEQLVNMAATPNQSFD